jgi:hypothetical protein
MKAVDEDPSNPIGFSSHLNNAAAFFKNIDQKAAAGFR